MTSPEPIPEWLLEIVERLHRQIRRAVRDVLVSAPRDAARPGRAGAGDVSFGIDLPAEHLIEEAFRGAPEAVIVVSEGLGQRPYPDGSDEGDAGWRVLIDPLDGSRELMYDKRSAWILTGVAPNLGSGTTLQDIAIGLMTEVPPTRQGLGAVVRARRGGGAFEEIWDLERDAITSQARRLETSTEPTLRYGFAPFARYFPGFHEPLGRVADAMFADVFPDQAAGEALAFDDAYISTGGQLYLLASGRYRMLADLRPMVTADLSLSLCAHPYDLAGALLVAEEAGAIVIDPAGRPLSYPLDTSTNCALIAFANEAIMGEAWPHLERAMSSLGHRVATP